MIDFKKCSAEEYQLCLDIRKKVFVEEQSVALEIEIDEYESVAVHFLLLQDNVAAATARIVEDGPDTLKIQRVAVLKEYRGKGIGRLLMENLLEYCEEANAKMIKLSAQEYAITFYEKLGFSVCSNMYYDANIPHYSMSKIL